MRIYTREKRLHKHCVMRYPPPPMIEGDKKRKEMAYVKSMFQFLFIDETQDFTIATMCFDTQHQTKGYFQKIKPFSPILQYLFYDYKIAQTFRFVRINKQTNR